MAKKLMIIHAKWDFFICMVDINAQNIDEKFAQDFVNNPFHFAENFSQAEFLNFSQHLKVCQK